MIQQASPPLAAVQFSFDSRRRRQFHHRPHKPHDALLVNIFSSYLFLLQAYLSAGDFSAPFNLSQARVNAALAESKAAARAAADARDAPPSKSESAAGKSGGSADAAAAANVLAADLLRSIPQVFCPRGVVCVCVYVLTVSVSHFSSPSTALCSRAAPCMLSQRKKASTSYPCRSTCSRDMSFFRCMPSRRHVGNCVPPQSQHIHHRRSTSIMSLYIPFSFRRSTTPHSRFICVMILFSSPLKTLSKNLNCAT